MSALAEAIVDILKDYAKINGVLVRSTSDLSPLEGWLLGVVVGLRKELSDTFQKKEKGNVKCS